MAQIPCALLDAGIVSTITDRSSNTGEILNFVFVPLAEGSGLTGFNQIKPTHVYMHRHYSHYVYVCFY